MAMYDSTLALTRIRGLMDKINRAMDLPNDNVLYFTTGEYANDSYRLVVLLGELDDYLTKNANTGDRILPPWWEPKKTGPEYDGTFEAILDGRIDPPSNPAGLSLQCSECGEWGGHFGSCSRRIHVHEPYCGCPAGTMDSKGNI